MNNLAELLALQGKSLDEAMTLVQTAIDSMGRQPSLLDTRAMVHLARGEFERAVEDMQAVVAEAPRANRYFHLARVSAAAGRRAAAVEALRKAQELAVDVRQLHPLEREPYRRLVTELK